MTRRALGSRPFTEPPVAPCTQLSRVAHEAVRLWFSTEMLGWRGKADFRQAMENLKRVLQETA